MGKKFLLRLPEDLHKELKEKSAQDNRSMHNLILLLLESCLPHFEPASVKDKLDDDGLAQ